MEDPWQRYVDIATELTADTRRRAEAIVRTLVRQGEVAADRAERSVEELLARSERNRRAIAAVAEAEVEQAVARLGLVPREEFDRLATRVSRLEEASSRAEPGDEAEASHDDAEEENR